MNFEWDLDKFDGMTWLNNESLKFWTLESWNYEPTNTTTPRDFTAFDILYNNVQLTKFTQLIILNSTQSERRQQFRQDENEMAMMHESIIYFAKRW